MRFTSVVSVIGLGYIGLPTAALVADKGYKVIGVDINQDVVDSIINSHGPSIEPGLNELVRININRGNLIISSKHESADIYVLCLPTPLIDDGCRKIANVEFVLEAINDLVPFLKKGDLVIIESTCAVGTTNEIVSKLASHGFGVDDILVAYCPERVLPGNILAELDINDRIVGGINNAATTAAENFYKSIVSGKVLCTSAKSAELCKLAENSYRDVNIAFANELSLICESHAVDVFEIIDLANCHPRVNILTPGSGVGGHCIAIDPWFIIQGQDLSLRPSIIREARELNDFKPLWILHQLRHLISEWKAEHGSDPVLACLGLTFKPDVDDSRESPALQIAFQLSASHPNVLCSDPYIADFGTLKLIDLSSAIEQADIIIYLVGHSEYRENHNRFKIAKKLVVDFCGVTK